VSGLSVRTKDSTMQYSKLFSVRRFQTFRHIVDVTKDIYSKLKLQTRTRNKCTVLIFARNIVFNFCPRDSLARIWDVWRRYGVWLAHFTTRNTKPSLFLSLNTGRSSCVFKRDFWHAWLRRC